MPYLQGKNVKIYQDKSSIFNKADKDILLLPKGWSKRVHLRR